MFMTTNIVNYFSWYYKFISNSMEKGWIQVDRDTFCQSPWIHPILFECWDQV